MRKLHILWTGELPLGEAFWTWAVCVSLFVNIATSVLCLALLTFDRPWWALVVGYGLSVPFNILVLVGVWRSAEAYAGPKVHGDLARVASLVLFAALSLT